ncbi:VOC family protein ['Paenibacillus yunnanensis' Narsing Rao et al. 2020]|uniref:VOC family protein n=1 Tax=Paenibacillus tengchongensis TaxID=2608684 RepID=UPI00124E6112|nr:VOC family protein [Paenibacillus tengchongensis]
MSIELKPFIMLDGHAREAIAFYQASLGAQLMFIQTAGEAPQQPDTSKSAAEQALIAHSVLRIGESTLFVSDSEPGQRLHQGNAVNICISVDNTGSAEQLFHALKEGGEVAMDLAPTYFSPAYGMLTDKYGVTFQIFTKRPG